jgi:Flp pilus assembly protein TadD
MSGYVVCESCGTRIKAGRPHCLKCFGPLPDPRTAIKPPLWESLGLSAAQKSLLGGVAFLVIAGLVGVIWETRPVPIEEQAAPAAGAAATTTPPVVAVAPPATANSSETTAPAVEPFQPTIAAPPVQVKPDAADIPALEATLTLYDQELVKNPDSADLFNRKGQVLERLGRMEEAATCFERAGALAPATRTYYFNLARVASTVGQSERAVGAYREVVRLQPQDYAARYTLGLALQKKGDDQGAISEFQKSVALDGRDPNVYLALGVSLERVGRSSDALPEYQRYVAMRPNSADAARLKEHLAALAGHP